jgi:methylmalonyl-CoA mutase cobalamin-binding subunit
VGLLQRVVAPLSQELGRRWRDGLITAAHEHFATEALRTYLGQSSSHFSGSDGAPVLLVATPAGQIHEMGALLASAAAAQLGWKVTYLGPSLPAAEIAGAARQNQARAVALSIVYPEDDPGVAAELARLRELLPERVAVLVGGRASAGYQDAIRQIGALEIRDLPHLCASLDELRRPQRKSTR